MLMKTLRILFTCCLLLAAAQMMADTWQDPQTEVNYTYTVGTGVASVSSGGLNNYYPYAGSPNVSGSINIRSKFTVGGKEYTVTSIGKYAFYNCKSLTSVTIPSTVTSTDYQSFYGCEGLTSISLPSGMTTIGEYTFGYCSGLKSITIPASVTTIGRIAFFRCTGLTKMSVEEGNTVYDSRDNCNGIIETATNTLIHGCKNTIIPNSVTSIGARVFNGCIGLESITIPSHVSSIGAAAFFACDNLEAITSLIQEPFEIEDDVFKLRVSPDEYSTATLYVPRGSKTKYQATEGWNRLENIVEKDVTDDNTGGDNIPTPKTDGVKALSVDPVTIAAGGTSEIVVNIDYDTNETVVGYNFSLYLPKGITLNTTNPFESGKLAFKEIKKCITLSEKVYPVVYSDTDQETEVDPRYFLNVMVKSDGGKLVMWIDNINKIPLKTTHGELLRLSVKAASDFESGNGLINGIGLTSDENVSLDLGNIADAQFGINEDVPVPTDNYIYMDNTEVKSGAEETLSFKMKNEAAIRGFQYNLYLPEGVTAVKSAKGKIQASLNSGRLPEEDEHTLAVTEQEDGSLLFLCGSQADETFTGNDGVIMTLKVKVAETMADGDYDVVMKNIKLSETDISKYYETNEKKAKLTVTSYMPGDINGDQKVDVSDYIGVANRILGIPQQVFIEKAGDVDESGTIDVSDYIGVANIILTGNVYGTAASRSMKTNTDLSATDNVLYVEPFTTDKGSQVQLSLKMKNTAPIRGFQFNLVLPEGVTVAKSAKGKILTSLNKDRLPAEDEHTLAAQEQTDGSVLFLCGSQYDECFTGNDGEIATITIDIASDISYGDYPVLLKNIKLTETDISKYYETAEVETTLTIGGKNGEKWGDVNNDGIVDVADIATIISIMASQARLQMEMEEE